MGLLWPYSNWLYLSLFWLHSLAHFHCFANAPAHGTISRINEGAASCSQGFTSWEAKLCRLCRGRQNGLLCLSAPHTAAELQETLPVPGGPHEVLPLSVRNLMTLHSLCCVPSLPTGRVKTSLWEVIQESCHLLSFPSLLPLDPHQVKREFPPTPTLTWMQESWCAGTCVCVRVCNYLTSTNIPSNL